MSREVHSENKLKSKKPLIYIAGPYTKHDPVLNTRTAIRAGMHIADSGLAAVEIPHLTMFVHLIEPRDLDYWYNTSS